LLASWEVTTVQTNGGAFEVEARTIAVDFSGFAPEVEMRMQVPSDCDAEEYVSEVLEVILDEKFKYGADWGFVDGIS